MTVAKVWDPNRSAWITVAGGPSLAQFNLLENRVSDLENSGLAVPFVTVLPSSPSDGQEVYYQNNNLLLDFTNTMADLGILWHLRYKASEPGPYKWYFLGGGIISTEEMALRTAALSSGNYFAWGLGSPAYLVFPLAGEYEVDVSHSIAGAAQINYYLYYNSVRDNSWTWYVTPTATAYHTAASSRRVAITAAGNALTVQMTANASISSNNYARRIRARPVRVG